MDFANLQVNEVTNDGVSSLTGNLGEEVITALQYVNKDFVELIPQEEKIYEAFYTFAPEEGDTSSESEVVVKQYIQFIKFSDELKVNVYKSEREDDGSSNSMVQVFTLDKGIRKKIYNFIDGQFDSESSVDTDEQTLELPDDFTELSDEENGTEDVSASGLACIQDGCCSFRYNGNRNNPIVRYKWCGANCGSGTPVNALDRCCRTHDNCYASYRSYPGRCACDRNLISCAANADNAGRSRLVTAFRAKMLAKRC